MEHRYCQLNLERNKTNLEGQRHTILILIFSFLSSHQGPGCYEEEFWIWLQFRRDIWFESLKSKFRQWIKGIQEFNHEKHCWKCLFRAEKLILKTDINLFDSALSLTPRSLTQRCQWHSRAKQWKYSTYFSLWITSSDGLESWKKRGSKILQHCPLNFRMFCDAKAYSTGKMTNIYSLSSE